MTGPMIPGDYLCVRTPTFAGRIIRWWLKSKWNHAAVYLGDGKIVEAQGKGAIINDLHYSVEKNAVVVNLGDLLSSEKRSAVIAAAESLVGTPYSWIDIAVLALSIRGIHFRWVDRRVSRMDRLICSQLVDVAYAKAGLHLFNDGRLPNEVDPEGLGSSPWGGTSVGYRGVGVGRTFLRRRWGRCQSQRNSTSPPTGSETVDAGTRAPGTAR